jgi:hypothetical protein
MSYKPDFEKDYKMSSGYNGSLFLQPIDQYYTPRDAMLDAFEEKLDILNISTDSEIGETQRLRLASSLKAKKHRLTSKLKDNWKMNLFVNKYKCLFKLKLLSTMNGTLNNVNLFERK